MMRGARLAALVLPMLAACTLPGPDAGDRLPPIAVRMLDPAPAPALAGQVLVINFWATWCGPCREELQSLDALARAHAGASVSVMGVSVDRDLNLVREFVARRGLAFAGYADVPGRDAQRLLDVRTLPVTLVVDGSGRIVARVDGARDWNSAEARALVARALSATVPPGTASPVRVLPSPTASST